jgi:putative ABC transport system permease protein
MTPRFFLDPIRQDLSYALRSLRRAPAFAAVAVLTLALGVGATTAIFSVVHGVLLRGLPYRDADRLAFVLERSPNGDQRLASYPTFKDWQAQSATFAGVVDGMAFIRGAAAMLHGRDGPERITGGFVTPGFFKLMGTAPLTGRTFLADEERLGANRTVVLSYELWQHRFGGDPSLVGKALDLDGAATTVIGVMPVGFAYPSWASFWQPIAAVELTDSALARRGVRVDSRVVARLHAADDSGRAVAGFRTVEARLAVEYPEESAHWTSVDLLPLRDEILGDIRPTLVALAGAVVLVLLLACANVANLFLVRAASRARELAVRSALGARRIRIAAQLFTESAVLGLGGGALGVLLAGAFVSAVRRAAAERLPRANEIGVDGSALLFALCVSVLAAVLVGVAPAIGATRANLVDRLRNGGRGSAGGARDTRIRAMLVVTQFAVALTLLIGAGLLIQSFRRVQAVPLGFEPDNLVAVGIEPPRHRYDEPAQAAALYDRLLDALRAVPGVTDVAAVNHIPLGGASVPTAIEVEGQQSDGKRSDQVLYRTASDGYLRTMRMRLARGRWFTRADMESRSAAFVINESMAKRYWPGGDAVGKRLTVHRASQVRPDFGKPVLGVVIGVVGDVRQFGKDAEATPELFVPYTLEVWPWTHLVVRVANPERAIPALKRALLEVEPGLPLAGAGGFGGFRTVTSMLSDTESRRRFAASLLGAFAGVALLLAALGLYGVIAYGVAQRTREMGVRIALGASEKSILRLVIGEGVKLALAGAVVGVACALALGHSIRAMLFGTTAGDPATYVAMAAVLTAAALLASYLPAKRAARLDPTEAIRGE